MFLFFCNFKKLKNICLPPIKNYDFGMENSPETQKVINYIQGRRNMSPYTEQCYVDIDEDIISKKINLPVSDIRLIIENLLGSNYERKNLVYLCYYYDKNNEPNLAPEDYDSVFFKLDVGKKYTLEINRKEWGKRIWFDLESGYLCFRRKKIYFKRSRQRKFLECLCSSRGITNGIGINFVEEAVYDGECNMDVLLRDLVKKIGKKIKKEWTIDTPFSFREERIFFNPLVEKFFVF